MLFKSCRREGRHAWCLAMFTLAWLLVISGLHYWLNIRTDKRQQLLMGYMPVITNMAAPLLDYASRDSGPIRFKALKFASFAEMAEALRNDEIQAAFIIAPLAIVLRQQGADIKVVYIGNRHESTLVARKDLNVKSLRELEGRTIAVPMRYSGHNISLLDQLRKMGLTGSMKIVEMNPPDMAAALATGRLDAYFVGEPFAATTLRHGDSSVVFYVEEVWRNFICNLVITKQSFIDENPAAVRALVQGAARSGMWVSKNKDEGAEIASSYWNQTVEVIKYAMDTPPDRVLFDKFIPREEELQMVADLMQRYELSEGNDISGLVDDGFAKAVSFEQITDLTSILAQPGQ